jgi:hypothetical protein
MTIWSARTKSLVLCEMREYHGRVHGQNGSEKALICRYIVLDCLGDVRRAERRRQGERMD